MGIIFVQAGLVIACLWFFLPTNISTEYSVIWFYEHTFLCAGALNKHMNIPAHLCKTFRPNQAIGL